jgi:hypothetical protein
MYLAMSVLNVLYVYISKVLNYLPPKMFPLKVGVGLYPNGNLIVIMTLDHHY